jgi:hypothetical protein
VEEGNMLSELQKRKLAALFGHHDQDRDGFLTKADYEGFAQRICELWDRLPGTAEYETAYAQNMAVWDYVQQVADMNHDGRISLDEFLASYDNTLSDEKLFDQMVVEYGTTLFNLSDRDGDGRISGAEMVGLLKCYGLPQESAQEAFRALDVDESGSLSVEQLMKRAREYYSDDPSAAGNWLFGLY